MCYDSGMVSKGKRGTWLVYQRIDESEEWTWVGAYKSEDKAEAAAFECRMNGYETLVSRG